MSRGRSVVRWVNTRPLHAATLLGLASVPGSAVSLENGSVELSLAPVLAAGFLAGVLYSRRDVSVARAGIRTGVVGSLSVLWALPAVAAVPNPLWLTVAFGALLVAGDATVSVLAGLLGAGLGGWLARRTGWAHRPSASGR